LQEAILTRSNPKILERVGKIKQLIFKKMKKQNVKNSLDFKKSSVVELNDGQLQEVNGGTTPFLSITSIFSIFPIPTPTRTGDPSRTRPSFVE
jgi:hypothetical protein